MDPNEKVYQLAEHTCISVLNLIRRFSSSGESKTFGSSSGCGYACMQLSGSLHSPSVLF
jgi:hypothetical protein